MADDYAETTPQVEFGPMGGRDKVHMTLHDTTANPGVLGLMAFGMTTLLLNIHNAGIYELNVMILAMGVFYGGLAQVIAGIMEWKKNSTFGMTAFLSYGFFWLTVVFLILVPKLSPWAAFASSETAMGYYFLAWGMFTGLMFIGTLRINRVLQTVFLTLTILFVLLAFRDWAGGAASAETLFGISGKTWGHIAGWEGIFVAFSAIYGSMGNLWNELYGRVVLPLGPYHK